MERRSITRKARTAFIILIDQSGSMADKVSFNGRVMSRAEVVTLLCNHYLNELVLRCKREGVCRDYYDVAVVSYSGSGVVSLFGDGKSIFVSITELESYLKRSSNRVCVERDMGDGSFKIERVDTPKWVDVKCSGETPMAEALSFIDSHLRAWVLKAGDNIGYMPMIFNITDGIASDCGMCDLERMFTQVKSIESSEGNPLLVNIHIAPADVAPTQTIFPTSADIANCDCRYLKVLFEGASDMPEEFHSYICSELNVAPPKSGTRFKGLGYNASLSSLFMMLNIGSTSVRRG